MNGFIKVQEMKVKPLFSIRCGAGIGSAGTTIGGLSTSRLGVIVNV
jgi:hypothetical protein